MESDRSRILVIDDEDGVRGLVQLVLDGAGFSVRTAVDGPDGLSVARDWEPQCILLDIMMPKIDGLSLIPLLRRLTDVPIIMLTARGDVRDRVAGLRAGADDYLGKPFNVDELIARIETALRRPALREGHLLRFADLEIDLEQRTVLRGEREVQLSVREFDLLTTLLRRPKRVFTRNELLDLVWGADRDVSTGTVETYISYLRSKIDLPTEAKLVHTVRGVGYALRLRPH